MNQMGQPIDAEANIDGSMPDLDAIFGEAATEVLDSAVGVHAATDGSASVTTAASQ